MRKPHCQASAISEKDWGRAYLMIHHATSNMMSTWTDCFWMFSVGFALLAIPLLVISAVQTGARSLNSGDTTRKSLFRQDQWFESLSCLGETPDETGSSASTKVETVVDAANPATGTRASLLSRFAPSRRSFYSS